MAAMDGHSDMQPASRRKLTYEDFLGFPDDGQRHELIDGEHYVTPSPATKHQRVSSRLHGSLYAYLGVKERGEVFHAPFDVVLSNYDVVEPDLLVILSEQSDILTDKHVRGAPAIVVEILSPGTRRTDEGVKRRLYERSGVRVVPGLSIQRAIVSRSRSAHPAASFSGAHELTAASGDVLTSPLLPEFVLRLETLFQ